jgi:hypothetical protein
MRAEILRNCCIIDVEGGKQSDSGAAWQPQKLAISAARGLHQGDRNAQETHFAWHSCHFT